MQPRARIRGPRPIAPRRAGPGAAYQAGPEMCPDRPGYARAAFRRASVPGGGRAWPLGPDRGSEEGPGRGARAVGRWIFSFAPRGPYQGPRDKVLLHEKGGDPGLVEVLNIVIRYYIFHMDPGGGCNLEALFVSGGVFVDGVSIPPAPYLFF